MIHALCIVCTAPASLFAEGWCWQDAPREIQRILNAQGGTPCDGGGEVGEWCIECEWCGWEGE